MYGPRCYNKVHLTCRVVSARSFLMQGLQSSALLNSEFNSSDLWHACSDLLTSKHEGGPKIGRESHVRQLRVRRWWLLWNSVQRALALSSLFCALLRSSVTSLGCGSRDGFVSGL